MGKRFDRIVMLRRRGAGTNALNEPTTTFEDVGELRARTFPAPGTEKYANAQNAATAPTVFEFRDSPTARTITADDIIRMDAVDYGVLSRHQQERGGVHRVLASRRN